MYNFIAETPWWLPTGFAVVGAALFWNGNNRQEAKVKYAGVIFLIAALVVGAVSYFLNSDRERVIANTRRIVAATGARDWATVERLLHPNVQVVSWSGKDELLRGAKDYTERYNVRDARTGLLSVQEPIRKSAIVTTQVFSNISEMSNFLTNWELEWESTDQGWLLRGIRPVSSPFLANPERYFDRRP